MRQQRPLHRSNRNQRRQKSLIHRNGWHSLALAYAPSYTAGRTTGIVMDSGDYVSVLNFIDFFPFHAKPMKAVNETGVFVDGSRRRCCKIPAGTCNSQCGAGGGLRAKAQSEPGVVGE